MSSKLSSFLCLALCFEYIHCLHESSGDIDLGIHKSPDTFLKRIQVPLQLRLVPLERTRLDRDRHSLQLHLRKQHQPTELSLKIGMVLGAYALLGQLGQGRTAVHRAAHRVAYSRSFAVGVHSLARSTDKCGQPRQHAPFSERRTPAAGAAYLAAHSPRAVRLAAGLPPPPPPPAAAGPPLRPAS